MQSKKTIVFLMLGNDHVANVHSLQGIYCQTCEHMILVAVNDCCEGFQSERFFYNLEDKPHPGVDQIIFTENQFPQGDERCMREYLKKLPADYAFMLHSGDTFLSADALAKAEAALEANGSAVAACVMDEIPADSCSAIFRVSEWLEMEARGICGIEAILTDLQSSDRLVILEEKICNPARLDCFHKPDYAVADLSMKSFMKTRSEDKNERTSAWREKIRTVLMRYTHRNMIALYSIVWLLLCGLYCMLSHSAVNSGIQCFAGIVCLASGLFTFVMLMIKVIWKLHREGKL